MKTKKFLGKFLLTALLAGFAWLVMMPFLFMLSSSFKPLIEIFQYPIQWIPDTWYPDNYIRIFTHDNSIPTMYWNSIKITCINVVASTITSILAAYAYSKMNFKGKNIFFLLMLATLMVPPQITYVPKFALFSWFNIMDTHWTLILPGLYAVFGTFLVKQFFDQIPNDLLEAARIDGAGELRICFGILTPISLPAISAFVITVFTNFWNEYDAPLIFLRSKELYTLPLGLIAFRDETGQMYNYIMAMTSISIIPIAVVFLLGQKYFIKGLTAGAVKG